MNKNDNLSNNFRFYKDEEPVLQEIDIKEDDIDLANKSLDTKSRIRDILLEYILQLNRLFENELSSSLREIRFSI